MKRINPKPSNRVLCYIISSLLIADVICLLFLGCEPDTPTPRNDPTLVWWAPGNPAWGTTPAPKTFTNLAEAKQAIRPTPVPLDGPCQFCERYHLQHNQHHR